MEVRRVSSNGCLSWTRRPPLSRHALAGEYVAFEEVDDGLWTVCVSPPFPSRAYDERHRSLHPIRFAVTGGRSASFAGSAPDLTGTKMTMIKTLDQLLPMSLD